MFKSFWTKKQRELNPEGHPQKDPVEVYLSGERIPWSAGYHEYKDREIARVINSADIMSNFTSGVLPLAFGIGLDERIVEYPWVLSHLGQRGRLLDAGSTLNQPFIVAHPKVSEKEFTIYTYFPEGPNFYQKRISYQYGDLRDIPYRDGYFDEIVCQSTLEHIDMDNSMYGYTLANTAQENEKSFEYLKVVQQMARVLNVSGTLLVTVPFGKFEKHGFFQQFDSDMLEKMIQVLGGNGISVEKTFFKYSASGWSYSNEAQCKDSKSFNPHTGIGKGTDGAAHSRAIACLQGKKLENRVP